MSGRVRVNAQLIDADTELHLWADTYDPELRAENIFEIQSEIAQQVAVALSVTLTAGELASIKRVPSENLEASDGQAGLNRALDFSPSPSRRFASPRSLRFPEASSESAVPEHRAAAGLRTGGR